MPSPDGPCCCTCWPPSATPFAATSRDARYVVVVGHGAEQVKAVLDDDVQPVDQAEQLGTGHAVAQAQPVAKGSAHVLVLNADVPLVSPETIAGLMTRHLEGKADLTFLTAVIDDPRGQGRVQRDASGRVTGIVEETDADAATLADNEVNVGVYCFRGDWLWPRLSRIERSAAGEYYLTDLIGMAVDDGSTLVAVPVADPIEALGINDRTQLAQAEAVVRERIRRRHMLAGVTIVDPATTYIDAGVTIGTDTTLYPSTYLGGKTAIGEECVIGPGSQVIDSTLGDRCRVDSSVVEQSTLEDGVDVGPFSHVRAGALHLQRRPHRQLRRGQELAPRPRHEDGPLQLRRRRDRRRRRQHRRRHHHLQLRRRAQAPHRHRRRRLHRQRHHAHRAGRGRRRREDGRRLRRQPRRAAERACRRRAGADTAQEREQR